MRISRNYYLNKIIDKRENCRIKIITGKRRCGKSYLLFNLFREYLLSEGVKEEQIISISLDDIDNIEYRNPFRLNEFIKEKTKNKSKQYYIQSNLNVDSEVKREQETASLKKIDDSLKKIVIVRNKIIPKHDNDGILYIGIEDFLLDEASIDS